MPKILTEIIGENGDIIKRKKFPIEGDTIVVKKPRPGPGGAAYKPSFNRNCMIGYKSGLFGMFYKRKLMLLDGAEQCVEFNKDGVALPSWDRKSLEDASKAHVIKAAGATVQKIQVPTSIYIVLFLVIILQVFNLLLQTGRVRI